MQVTIHHPSPEDLDYIAQHMRAADITECAALDHHDLRAVLADGVNNSLLVWAASVDGVPACVMGVAPYGGVMTSSVGIPWMLGTDAVQKHRRALIRMAPRYIDEMLKSFSHLLNYVHADNHRAVQWLRHIGFTVHPAEQVGPLNAWFHPFELRA